MLLDSNLWILLSASGESFFLYLELSFRHFLLGTKPQPVLRSA
jgi:hypothetical protein